MNLARKQEQTISVRRDNDRALRTGPLLWHETRLIAVELAKGEQIETIRTKVLKDNLLQRPSNKTASNIFSYIKKRLLSGPAELIPLIASSDMELSKQATFVAIANSSRFFFEFLGGVITEKLLSFAPHLESNYWDRFWESCVSQDPDLASVKIKSVTEMKIIVQKILFEIGITKNLGSLELKRIRLHPELVAVLKAYNDKELLHVMRAFV